MTTKKSTKAKRPTKATAAKKSTKTTAKRRSQQPGHWFAAKRYGYGWGRPLTWQGAIVYLTFIASIVWYFAWASHRIASEQTFGWSDQMFVLTGFFILMAVAVPVLAGICALKGEPAQWRWGNPKRK